MPAWQLTASGKYRPRAGGHLHRYRAGDPADRGAAIREKGGKKPAAELRRYALTSSLLLASVSYILIFFFAVPIAGLFNRNLIRSLLRSRPAG